MMCRPYEQDLLAMLEFRKDWAELPKDKDLPSKLIKEWAKKDIMLKTWELAGPLTKEILK